MKVALFSTCIVDTLKPEIGFATLTLLEAAGCEVSVPTQSCCGQANFNNGDTKGARALALQWLKVFEAYEYVVIPSGSCAAMLKIHGPSLFSDDEALQLRFKALTQRSYELSAFLSEIACPVFEQEISTATPASYHDSCSGLRDLYIKAQPRALLAASNTVELTELSNAEACCGFGGTFCVKHPEISCRLADDKIATLEAADTRMLIGGDWGCLMHLKGRIDALNKPIDVKHFSEVLASAIKGAH
ncbi:MAG: (Fe-S)-binding protein [Arenicellales bacterium]